MSTVAPSQRDVGRALRRARQRHHVGIEEAVTATRIPKRYLEALEDNAPLDTFPAPVYARAFLREYARYLEIDPEPLLERLGPTEAVPVRLGSMREAVPPPRRWLNRALLSVSILVLVGLAAAGMLSGRGAHLPAAATGAGLELPAGVSSSPVQGPGPGPVAPNGIKAVVNVTGRTWVDATVDGTQGFRGIWDSNWHVLHADSTLEVTFGNAGGARLMVNGRRIPTGATGEVVHLSLALQNGKIHVTRA